jgi:hypothetical protein
VTSSSGWRGCLSSETLGDAQTAVCSLAIEGQLREWFGCCESGRMDASAGKPHPPNVGLLMSTHRSTRHDLPTCCCPSSTIFKSTLVITLPPVCCPTRIRILWPRGESPPPRPAADARRKCAHGRSPPTALLANYALEGLAGSGDCGPTAPLCSTPPAGRRSLGREGSVYAMAGGCRSEKEGSRPSVALCRYVRNRGTPCEVRRGARSMEVLDAGRESSTTSTDRVKWGAWLGRLYIPSPRALMGRGGGHVGGSG